MNRPRVRGCILILIAAQGPAIAWANAEPSPEPTTEAKPGTVVIVASNGSCLAAELKRELEISAFHVSLMPGRPPGADWKEHARALVSAELPRVVAVRADERNISVLLRSSSADGVQASLDLELDPDDRLTRRRACLTVVEYLRVLGEAADRELVPPSPATAAVQVQDPAQDPVTAESDAARTAESAAGKASRPPTRVLNRADNHPSIMGVGTTLDVSSAWEQPAGHLQFMWYFPFSARVSVRARAQWPLFGVGFQSSGMDVRMWTFGAAIGLQYAFAEPPSRWRPFIGLAIGNRIALTEASSDQPLQSRTAVTPSANLNLEAGLRYALSPRVQIFVELEGGRDWLVPTAHRVRYETDAANAVSVHASVGVLFEY